MGGIVVLICVLTSLYFLFTGEWIFALVIFFGSVGWILIPMFIGWLFDKDR